MQHDALPFRYFNWLMWLHLSIRIEKTNTAFTKIYFTRSIRHGPATSNVTEICIEWTFISKRCSRNISPVDHLLPRLCCQDQMVYLCTKLNQSLDANFSLFPMSNIHYLKQCWCNSVAPCSVARSRYILKALEIQHALGHRDAGTKMWSISHN